MFWGCTLGGTRASQVVMWQASSPLWETTSELCISKQTWLRTNFSPQVSRGIAVVFRSYIEFKCAPSVLSIIGLPRLPSHMISGSAGLGTQCLARQQAAWGRQ